MLKAIAYTRVSTDKQANDGISLDNQISKIKAYAEFNDMEIVEIIQDAGKSGKTLKREGIKRVIDLCENKEIDAVIVYQFSRLTRSTKDLLFLVEDIFDKNGVSFHSINEKVDTSTPQGKFFLTIIGAMNQMEREEISFRTKDALAHKKTKGERLGAIPFGYKLVNGSLIEVPEEQKAIALVKQLKSDGFSIRKIALEMERREIKTAKGAVKWHIATIQRILANG